MFLSRALAPSSEKFPLKRILVKKVFTTFIAGLAMLSATLNTVGDTSLGTDKSDQDDSSYSIRLGLSRTRPAFRKAIGMLANAADSNERLAEYYERVAKRVTGNSADGEQSSGVIVVKPIKKKKKKTPRAKAAK